MKKYSSFVLCLLCISFGLALADDCTVCSFNIRRLGEPGWDAKRDFNITAQIVRNCHVLVVYEVRSLTGANRLLAALQAIDANWTMSVTSMVGTQVYQEAYGYYWRANHVQPVETSVWCIYPNTNHAFARGPSAAFFRAGQFDFVIVAEHISFDVAKRKAEINKLPAVITWARATYPGEDDFIVAGDFNEGGNHACWQSLQALGFVDVLNNALTTFGKTKPRSQPYDHIWLLLGTKQREFTGLAAVVEFDKLFFGGNFKLAQQKVSDHLAVWGVYHTNLPDDD